jgi:hypothetical protein
MADPRKKVKFDGIGAEYASYLIDNSTITYDATKDYGSAVAGRAVALSCNGTVALVADDGRVHGKLISVEADGIATVQFRGYMALPGGVGASLTLGKRIVGAVDGSANKGFIKERADASAGSGAEINALAKAVGEIVDPSVTTAVWVLL